MIAIIRSSDDAAQAKERLISVFDLSDAQATYILDMPLRRLTKFSRIELETEVPVRMSNVPLEAVVLGAGHVIEHYEALRGMFMGARR